jgi:hypothetical protein
MFVIDFWIELSKIEQLSRWTVVYYAASLLVGIYKERKCREWKRSSLGFVVGCATHFTDVFGNFFIIEDSVENTMQSGVSNSRIAI